MQLDAGSSASSFDGSGPVLRTYVPALLFFACLAAQLYLVLFKSLNWDEFVHFSQVYQLKAGTLSQSLQVLHSRILWWSPEVAANLLDQMRAARIFMWGMNLLTLLMIYGIARRFTTVANSFFASFAYLGAGYVFTQAFSIRPDPMVTATLMCALFLMSRGTFSLLKAIAVGALIGLAGMMTVKAAFYAPCFAGLAWLHSRETPQKVQYLGKLAILAIAAFLSFGAIYLYHSSELVAAAKPVHSVSTVSLFLRWVTQGVPFAHYILKEIILAPLFFISLVLAPFAWSRARIRADEKLALAGFVAPLVVFFFYRNTFPYFFVFILAPVAVAVAPALGLVRDRYGNAFLALVLALMPLTLTVLEPRDIIERQRALIDYVHQEYPAKTGYLDYSGMIADYPRIIKHLTSGNGIAYYHQLGDPTIGRDIDSGKVPFIIANQYVILAALEGQPIPETFLPADLAAMRGNYVRQWGVLWREGKLIPAGSGTFRFELRRGGDFVVAGDPVTIDGVTVTRGMRIKLAAGTHFAAGTKRTSTILWRGDKLPAVPPNVEMDRVFTNF